jgi:hypothetical protein
MLIDLRQRAAVRALFEHACALLQEASQKGLDVSQAEALARKARNRPKI